MAEVTTPSGAKVSITISDYSTCFDLFKAVLKAVRQGGIASKIPDNLQLSDLAKLPQLEIRDLGGILDAIIDVITSPEVEALLWKCMERVVYDGERVTKSLFEDEAKRGDFLFLAYEVLKENLRPFFSQMSFLSKTISPEKTSSRKSK